MLEQGELLYQITGDSDGTNHSHGQVALDASDLGWGE